MSQDSYSSEVCVLIFVWKIFSPASVIFTGVGVLLSVRAPFNISVRAYCNGLSLRQLRTFGQAKAPFWISLSESKCSFDVSTSIPK